MFQDRRDAGQQLARELQKKYKDKDVVALALPRGGVPVAFEVAEILHVPLDILFVRKLGAPFQSELAIGAIADGDYPERVLNERIVQELDLPDSAIEEESQHQMEEIARRKKMYEGHRRPLQLKDKIALIIDDGIATGATIQAAVAAARKAGAQKVVIAVPVASPDIVMELRKKADEVVCLDEREDLWGVSMAYRDFQQVSDDEVIAMLDRASRQEAPPET